MCVKHIQTLKQRYRSFTQYHLPHLLVSANTKSIYSQYEPKNAVPTHPSTLQNRNWHSINYDDTTDEFINAMARKVHSEMSVSLFLQVTIYLCFYCLSYVSELCGCNWCAMGPLFPADPSSIT